MAKDIRVRAVKGFRVRDPLNGEVVPEEGSRLVESGSYWDRRIAAGEIVLVDATSTAKAAPRPEKG